MASASDQIVVVVPADDAAVGTVAFACREARDRGAELGAPVRVSVVVLAPVEQDLAPRLRRRLEGVGDRLTDALVTGPAVSVLEVGADDLEARTAAVIAHLADGALSRIVVDPRTELSVEALRAALGVARVELAPSGRAHRHRRLVGRGGSRRLTAVFVLTYGFYLALGGFAGGTDLVTGALSAAVIALTLGRVTFDREPTLRRSGTRLLRLLVVAPVVLWEVVRANVALAAVILRPSLPVDPSLEEVETATAEDLERFLLANVLTLTPGTLVVDVRGGTFEVHSLTSGARGDVSGGRLERLVRWVFHGRSVRAKEGGGADP